MYLSYLPNFIKRINNDTHIRKRMVQLYHNTNDTHFTTINQSRFLRLMEPNLHSRPTPILNSMT